MPNPYAAYDAMGNMTCRNTDPTSGHTCGSSPTGAQMSYDNEGRLASWTAPSGTTASDGFLYDNAGNRVLQRVNTGSVTDTITFDGYSETVLTGGTITPTRYYNINGQRVAMRTNSTLSYLLSDVLGSSTIALTSSGSTQAVQLFAPYGSIRYSQGNMPTTYNFTGQRLDSQTGLLYYGFRYYDPVSGRFVRADTTQTNAGGMDPYAYVGNNPEGRTDPTGHFWPWATMLVGAIAGAVIGVAVTTVTSYATTGKPPSGGELLQAAVSGAVSGAIVGLLGPGASVVGAIGIGALSGAVSGVAGRLAYNAVTRTSLSDGLVQAGVEGAVIGGLTGGVLKAAAPLLDRVGGVLGKGLRTVARRLLQNVTDDQNVLLSANPGIARNFLSPNQYAAGQRLPWVANMNYGTALENMVADQVENSPLRFLYRHMGTDMLGQQVPDFVGRGPFSGMNFDITTDNPTQIASHLNRPYGQGLIIIPYLRPAYFFLFP